ncbi:tetratricopeptide repeat protein [Streptomyces chrestomyceticus]|uniref:tetratricopeptide repeat protein n=1 Tax=Streptomyces chrestomyceticus TaxID=68185 RepID=UPI0035A876DC
MAGAKHERPAERADAPGPHQGREAVGTGNVHNTLSGGQADFVVQAQYVGTLYAAGPRTAQSEPADVTVVPPWGEREGLRLQGRDELLRRLMRAAAGARGGRVQVLHGLGGVGKTSLALEVAHRFRTVGEGGRDGSGHVWWVQAHDTDRLAAGMHAVAARLGAGHEALSGGRLADWLWQRLSDLPEHWLLVLDNADDLAVLDGPGRLSSGTGWVRPHGARRGLVMVTTRDPDPIRWGRHPRFHAVPVLSANDGARVLTGWAGPRAGGPGEAASLAERLGGLPIALDTAGRYLAAVHDRPPIFRGPGEPDTYAGYQAALDRGSLLGDGEGTLAGIWDMSLKLIEERGRHHARPLLQLLACFASAPLPVELLDPRHVTGHEAFAGVSGKELWDTLTSFRSLGLVLQVPAQRSASASSGITAIALHPLVHDGHQHPGLRPLAVGLLDAYAARFGPPESPATWPHWTILAPHLQNALGTAPRDEETFAALQRAATLTARGLCASRQASLAEQVIEPFLAALRRVRGEDHPDVLTARRELALVHHIQGHHALARRTFDAVLDAQEHALGVDHPLTLSTRQRLARLLRDQGLRSEARRAYDRLLPDCRRVLGRDHPDTLNVHSGLAMVLHDQGLHDRARHSYAAVLAVQERALGPGHPDALRTRHSLARVLHYQGHHDQARREYETVLAAQQGVLGADHPTALNTRHNLALVLYDQGHPDQARAHYEAVLPVWEGNWGRDNPGTLATKHELGRVLASLGETGEAVRILQEVLAARSRTLGPDHPDTQETRAEVARLS